MYSNKNKEDLKKVEELDSLQSQVKEVRLQDKLGDQIHHYDAKNIQEPPIDTIKNTSENVTTTITETSIKNNKQKSFGINEQKGLDSSISSFFSSQSF